MIQLTKDNTASPDVYSTDDGTDPVSISVIVDGADITESPATSIYVWANDDTTLIASYSSISVAFSGSDAGVTWELSLDGATNWGASISLGDLDVSSTHQATQIYARATVVDGTLTGDYETPDFVITASENPVSADVRVDSVGNTRVDSFGDTRITEAA
jgi:hypothetical protein